MDIYRFKMAGHRKKMKKSTHLIQKS